MILLSGEAQQLTPAGIAWIVVFAVIIGAAVIYDRKKAKKFSGSMEEQFAGRIMEESGNIFVTTDKELVAKSTAPTYVDYEIFSLENVAYVMAHKDKTAYGMWALSLYDSNKKIIKGVKIRSTKKKPQKTNAYILTNNRPDEAVELVLKYVPNAQLVGLGFKNATEVSYK